MHPQNTFPVSESVLKTVLGSYEQFFHEMDSKSPIRKKFYEFEPHFIKKVPVAGEERLKNTVRYGERVQGV